MYYSVGTSGSPVTEVNTDKMPASNDAEPTASCLDSGVVEYNAVHARYQYYGKLMVSSVTGSAFANKGEKKVLTNIKLKYNTSKHSRAGSFWFERMKADRLNDILSGAIKIAGGK